MLLENDLVRVWRFELPAGYSRCHAHQHVYPYFFLNLRDIAESSQDTSRQPREVPEM